MSTSSAIDQAPLRQRGGPRTLGVTDARFGQRRPQHAAICLLGKADTSPGATVDRGASARHSLTMAMATSRWRRYAGGTMREWLANEANGGAARPWPERLRVISEIAHWLVYMHTHGGGIWHMDVKKGNFFLSSTLMSASQPRSGANRLRRCRRGPWPGRCFTWRPSASRRPERR